MASVFKSFKVNQVAVPTTARSFFAANGSAGAASSSSVGASPFASMESQSYLAKLSSYISLLSPASLKGSTNTSTFLTILAILATFLIFEQLNYRRKKGGLPGPAWTIPIIGKFMDSLHPSLEKYQAGWNSGPLSVASVFHM